MSAALKTADLAPELKAFIAGAPERPVPVGAVEERRIEERVASQAEEVPREAPAERRIAPKALPHVTKWNGLMDGPLVSLSVRIPSTLHTALMTASFQRRLERADTYTHQDIVGEALAAWLKKHGYA